VRPAGIRTTRPTAPLQAAEPCHVLPRAGLPSSKHAGDRGGTRSSDDAAHGSASSSRALLRSAPKPGAPARTTGSVAATRGIRTARPPAPRQAAEPCHVLLPSMAPGLEPQGCRGTPGIRTERPPAPRQAAGPRRVRLRSREPKSGPPRNSSRYAKFGRRGPRLRGKLQSPAPFSSGGNGTASNRAYIGTYRGAWRPRPEASRGTRDPRDSAGAESARGSAAPPTFSSGTLHPPHRQCGLPHQRGL